VNITVPAVPAGHHPAACWRKTIIDIDPTATGGLSVEGHFLHAGDTVDLPTGTLIVAVDKTTTGWDRNYRTNERFAIQDATVTIHRVDEDGLSELWNRHYKQAKSAFGATTTKKIRALLAAHPSPNDLPPALVHEAQRPAGKAGTCRWCEGHISAAQGHQVGHGESAALEHWQQCPIRPAATGTPCALCGVTVMAADAQQILVREGEGRWEIQHRNEWGKPCTEAPRRSAEDQLAEIRAHKEAQAAAEQKAADRRAAAKAKRDAKKAETAAAERAERERVSRLAVIKRETRNVYAKQLGYGRGSATLDEHTDTLEDGTSVLRWTVTAEGQSADYEDLTLARIDYQSYKWGETEQYAPAPQHRTLEAATCPTPDVRHCDNCGTTQAPGGWMSASLGQACDVDCYDAMSDQRGRHHLRYHR
jgi:hypothetical protein